MNENIQNKLGVGATFLRFFVGRLGISCVLLLLFFGMRFSVNAQAFAYTAMDPVNLVNNILLGDELTATNIQFRNGTAASSIYTTTSAINLKKFTTSGGFPFSDGVYIKTGGTTLNDPDLDLLRTSMNLGNVTNGGILEFDFVAQGTELNFEYMFASSEYNNYTCSNYNDVFAFFLSGPGISGPYSNNGVNLATIPNSPPPGTPIVVNSVNCGCKPDAGGKCSSINPNYISDAQYWTNAYGSYGNEGYNGGSVPLTAHSSLICGATYHIKMAIANIQDTILQSGVYLKGQSFVIPTTAKIDVVKEIETQKVCVSDSIEFDLVFDDNDFEYDSLLWNFNDSTSSDSTSTLDNPKHKFNEPGTYIVNVIVFNENSVCKSIDTIEMELIVHDYERDTVIAKLCYGEHYTLTNGNQLTISGTYNDTIPSNDLTQCDKITTIKLFIPTEKLTIDLVDLQHVSCWGDQDGSLSVSASGGVDPYLFKWTSTTYANFQNTNPTIVDLSAGTYLITVSDAHNCKSTEIMDITQPDKLTLTLSPDTLICPYDFASLSGKTTGGTAPFTIDWGNGQTAWNIQTTPTQDSVFHVSVSDKNACTDTKNVAVKIVQLPTVAFNDTPLIGCTPLHVSMRNSSSGKWDNCLWEFSDGFQSTNCDLVIHQVQQIGNHSVTLTLNTVEGCTISHTAKDLIHAEAFPIADFYADQNEFIAIDENLPEVAFTNTSKLATSYLWNFGDGSDLSNEVHTWHTFPTEQGHKYSVSLTAFNDLGCADTHKIVIVVREPELFFIPNTFTPNNDPYNPYYQPVITSGIDASSYLLKIYDRWGNILFETNDIHHGWDGIDKKGNQVQDGTYNWELQFIPSDLSEIKHKETKVVKGHLNLIR